MPDPGRALSDVPGEAPGQAPAWWAPEALARVWSLLAARLERNGRRATGRLVIEGLARSERHALSGLLGLPVTAQRAHVDLAQLDRRLLDRSGHGLVGAVELVLGRPLADRPGELQEQRRRRQAPIAIAEQWLAEHPDVSGLRWVMPWLDGLRADGYLQRAGDPAALITASLEVLAELVRPGRPATARTDLAAAVLHDAHALDDGTQVAHVVLRGLALRAGTVLTSDAAGRREIWETAGVSADRVSTTCLVLGVATLADHGVDERLRLAARDGDPAHVTWWDLSAGFLPVDGQDVLVCENPRVLEAVAERFGGRRAVVCTSGRPSLVAVEALRRLRDAAARLRYHGDFDWPGIAIANQLIGEVAVQPWQMSADAYSGAPAGPALTGPVVEPAWDEELGPAMRHRGLAVHEEAVLPQLLSLL